MKRGPWSPEEDAMLKAYIEERGTGNNWIALPHKIGNYLPRYMFIIQASLAFLILEFPGIFHQSFVVN